ncbi:hypothetical protein LWI29_018586 [Acer saccharum]|uniref:Uncharacterized protein n=1 Tax=Acer saccharum TaxID=4024 RepID=A0AA39STX0_ACESA|nr:hypothetical protein LWI29_018586 [Acer saccharum]
MHDHHKCNQMCKDLLANFQALQRLLLIPTSTLNTFSRYNITIVPMIPPCGTEKEKRKGREAAINSCQHSNPSFAKFLLRRRHYPISAANLPTDTIVASPSVRCSSTRNGVIVEATKEARSSDPVRMGSSAAEATTGRSKAMATVAVRWWRLWQQGRSEKFFSSSGRCP